MRTSLSIDPLKTCSDGERLLSSEPRSLPVSPVDQPGTDHSPSERWYRNYRRLRADVSVLRQVPLAQQGCGGATVCRGPTVRDESRTALQLPDSIARRVARWCPDVRWRSRAPSSQPLARLKPDSHSSETDASATVADAEWHADGAITQFVARTDCLGPSRSGRKRSSKTLPDPVLRTIPVFRTPAKWSPATD